MVGILGANSVSGGYEISNSLRTANASAEVLQKTLSGNGNRRTFTYSGWLKKSYIQVNADPYPSQFIFFSQAGSNSNDGLRFVPDGNKLGFLGQNGGSTTFSLTASASFRDPSAWYHIVAAVDTTQGTASNRVKLYVNGVQLTVFDQAIYPSENLDTNINTNGVSHRFQGQIDTDTNYFRGYGSEIHLIDGAAKAPTDFGEFDNNGVWIPKAYTGAYGTHGVYFEFKQTGTDADASGMGADTSGNDNHYTPTNLTADSVTTDTPTNNFATANPLYGHGEADIKEGNCLLDAGGDITAPSTIGFSSGKWYMEMKSTITAGTGNRKVVGIYSSDDPLNNPRASDGASDNAYPFTGVIVNLRTGVAVTSGVDGNATDVGTFANNDICSLAYDGDNGLLYIYKNGTILNSGNALNAGNALDTSKTYLFYLNQDGGGSNNGELFLNFGNPPFAISSSNADANGYGNFEYAVPSGFYSLCTKNLAEFG